MPTVNPSPFGPKPQFFDAAGNPDLSYKLFAYVAGSTSTKQNTYTNSTGNVANSNPIILNSLGQTPNEFWFTQGQLYKVVLAPSTDTDPPTNPVWTIDNLQGINDSSGSVTVDQWQLFSSAPFFISASSFSLTGNQTDVFHVGRRLQLTLTSGNVYGRITNSVFASNTVVTLQMDGSQVLDSSLSAVYYSLLTNNVLATPARIANTSGTNTYTASVGILRFVAGDEYEINFVIPNDGTTPPTINLDGLGAAPIILQNGVVPYAGAINGEHTLRRSGSNFILLDPIPILSVPYRQSIQYGPLTTAQPPQPDLIQQSQIGNTIAVGVTLKCSLAPTLFSVANGFNSDGSPLNLNWLTSVDIVVSALAASSTNYIWVDTVAKSAGSVTVADTIQNGGTIPVTANKYTFDYYGMKMYLGNGTTAPQSNRVIVAEVDTSATVVTAIRVRPYLNRYSSPVQTVPGGGSANTVNHNSGYSPTVRMIFTNITADGGYSPGDTVNYANSDNGGQATNIFASRNSCGFAAGGSIVFVGKTGAPARFAITTANWQISYVTTPPWL